MPIFYKIAQLVINPDRSSTVSRAYISQPSTSQEESLGRLIVLGEFAAKKPDYQALFNLVVDEINLAYYENEQIVLLDKLATVTVASIFESALSKLNQSLYDIWQSQSLKFSQEELSLTIGVVHENKLYFANLGRNKALLIYKPKTLQAKHDNPYSLVNITKKTFDPREELASPNKIMSNIVSGMVPTNGYFLFCNEALYEYLSERQLIKIISTLPPASAAVQIENLFQQSQLAVPFSLIIIKNHKGQELMEASEPTVVSYGSPDLRPISTHHNRIIYRPEKDINKESIKALNRTQAMTDAILKPSGLINLRRLKNLGKAVFGLFKRRQQVVLKIVPAKMFERKEAWSSFKKLGISSANLVVSLISLLHAGLQQITQREKRQHLMDKVRLLRSRITKTHLIMIIIVVVCLAAFITNLSFIRLRDDRQRSSENFKELVKAIKAEESQLSANMLYDNKDKARTILNKIGTMLNDIPKITKNEQAEFDAIKLRYQKNLEQVNDVIRVDNLDTTALFSNAGKLSNLVAIDQYLYLTNDDKIIRLDKNTKDKEILPSESVSMKFGSTEKSGIYWLLADKQVLQVSSANNKPSLKRYSIDSPSNPKGMELYYNKLYIYSADDKQLYRYLLSTDGFKDKSAWLKNNEGIDDIRSLSIDSYVYLLDKTTIHKYGQGRKQNFNLSAFEPAMEDPQKIIAMKDGQLLFVLEPKLKRILVFNKDGKFINQYASVLFDDLQDFAIDEQAQLMYILSGTTVYQMKLP